MVILKCDVLNANTGKKVLQKVVANFFFAFGRVVVYQINIIHCPFKQVDFNTLCI